MLKNSILLASFFTLVSCVSDGVAPGSILNIQYDGVTCDEIVLADMGAGAFEALIKAGTSAADLFTICIGDNVSINAGGTSTIKIDDSFVMIQGFSNTTSKLYQLEINGGFGFSNTHTSFRRLKIIGANNSAIYQVSHGGSSSVVNVTNSNLESAGIGMRFNGGGGGSMTFTVSKTNFNTQDDGIQARQGGGGALIGTVDQSVFVNPQSHSIDLQNSGGGRVETTLTNSSFTTSSNALSFENSGGGPVSATMGGLTLRASGANGSGSAIYLNGDGGIVANKVGGNSVACNVSGSIFTFNDSFEIDEPFGGGGPWGDFEASINTVIGTCP